MSHDVSHDVRHDVRHHMTVGRSPDAASVRIDACADDALLMTFADEAGEGATEKVISAWKALRALQQP